MKINGQLVFDASSASEIQNLRVQKVASNPTWVAADVGRLIYNTGDNTVYVGGASAWVAVATGGDAAALAERVDNIIAALDVTDNNGDFDATAVNAALANVSGATTLLEALEDLDAAITAAAGVDTLGELSDVTLTSPTTGQFLRKSAGDWENHTLVLADVTDVTATATEVNLALDGITASAAELNILDGVTGTSAADISSIAGYAAEGISAAEFGHLDGVTSNIQDQLDNKQPLDATLTALAAYNTNGLVVQTAADTFTGRSLVQPAAGITITNADGVAGNPTFALANDLAAIEGLATTGIVVRTGDGTATTRTITGTSGEVVVANGDGVSSEPTISLADAGTPVSNEFVKITTDAKGRVTATTAVGAGDITALVDNTYVNVAGDTMTGNLTMSSGATVTGLPSPSGATDAANKAYVDAVAEGLHVHAPTQYVSASNLVATYANGTGGVGATLTANANGALSLDGGSPTAGQRIMVVGQTNTFENGIYVVTATGDGSNPFVLTRASDFDTTTEIAGGDFVFNQLGTQYGGTGWVQTETTAAIGSGNPILFAQFSGAGTYQAGTGLSLNGTMFNVNLGAGIFELPTDEVGIELHDASTGAIILTTDGSARSTASGSRLHLLLAGSGGLTQDATGLYIPAAGVTNAMLANDGVTSSADSGSPVDLNLGDTLHIEGVSTQGTSVAVSKTGNTVEYAVTVADASSSQKGVASFDATEFTVTTGDVELGVVPIAKLSENDINFVGTDASADLVQLGESVTFASAVTGLVSAAVATNTITLDVRLATTTATGVASFNTDHFSVSSGAVSLAATLDDLTNVSTADAAATDSLLTKSAGDWVPVSRNDVVASTTLTQHSDVSASHVDGHALISNGTNWVDQKIYHLHTQGSASTTWTVTHNLGVQYCNVTVVDDTDEVVIPQSITFNSTTQLTVTFNTSISGHVVVMGVA